MLVLKDFMINGVSLAIIEKNRNNIILHIENMGKKVKTNLADTRYISVKKGILTLYSTSPSMHYSTEGQIILPFSFIDVELVFEKYDATLPICNNDRIDLHLQNIADILLLRNNNQWFVQEYSEKSKVEEFLNSCIEHFEVIEDKIGISLQNMSVSITGDHSIKLYCEVLPLTETGPICSFAIETAVYNKSNKVIGFNSIRREKSDFLGFEVFSFGDVYLSANIEEIGKIVFYPTKI